MDLLERISLEQAEGSEPPLEHSTLPKTIYSGPTTKFGQEWLRVRDRISAFVSEYMEPFLSAHPSLHIRCNRDCFPVFFFNEAANTIKIFKFLFEKALHAKEVCDQPSRNAANPKPSNKAGYKHYSCFTMAALLLEQAALFAALDCNPFDSQHWFNAFSTSLMAKDRALVKILEVQDLLTNMTQLVKHQCNIQQVSR
ncbi:uncharacterized protein PFL1_01299 [Pseudozyma flocculosa PF-1]|uniref:Uncharacterized protein n=1 Tax=Pseudozyma flocculosa TaxID=84751 RepID=A0A5C3EVU6_9BASI|nr:uncharacterized protein PFL1_01299 [Pseudozyma flocculosa PF-1]EPQ31110.1 hypothetical protein PFL1_01299 [Pseudozyma flocculosa PF-1]SPO35970.1 uncharacterized protein PSFLO_01441 [Pseudozyma flocculosa]